jgi:CheY-like chemotaxis protein
MGDRGGKILIVEDNDKNRRLVADVLSYYGYDVIQATNGEEAINMTREYKPDLIFMDMQMPVMDGYEATARLREAGYIAPIIALTANAMSTDREKCLQAGCDDYLAKPIDRARLITLVTIYAARQQLRQDGDAPAFSCPKRT